VVRQGRSIALVVAFLIGCSVLLVAVGCAGVGSEAPQKEQTHSPQATASEEARCQGTSTTKDPRGGEGARALFTTNDIPGCPKGGLLLGTEKGDLLAGEDGDDVIRGLGGKDTIVAGPGNDKTYGGDGNDSLGAWADPGEDVLYGGDGNDFLWSHDRQRDKSYAGKGKDQCTIDKLDYVDSSCEKKKRRMPQV
jgi:RTX calcium-binding nonapeptide repeat (4 copies)